MSPADDLQHQQSVSEYDHQIFHDMFKKVAHADFSSYLAKLQTPRELVRIWRTTNLLPCLSPLACPLETCLIRCSFLPPR